ncbi:hypothetical protein [Streptomyces sp. NPDC015131]|uniref:DUF6197 family protein n=1 Tax=Streptomyces sp. NPDC015131 TaxID=3364941 RepID=UPI003702500B
MNDTDILAEGAEYIAEHGHVKGKYFADDVLSPYGTPAACAMGAMAAANRNGNWETLENAKEKLAKQIKLDFPDFIKGSHTLAQERVGVLIDPHAVIAVWNDDPDRTAEEVILTMKKAAHDGD